MSYCFHGSTVLLNSDFTIFFLHFFLNTEFHFLEAIISLFRLYLWHLFPKEAQGYQIGLTPVTDLTSNQKPKILPVTAWPQDLNCSSKKRNDNSLTYHLTCLPKKHIYNSLTRASDVFSKERHHNSLNHAPDMLLKNRNSNSLNLISSRKTLISNSLNLSIWLVTQRTEPVTP